MLKYVFCTLLIANGVLFAWHQGYLDGMVASGHEPGRLLTQQNAGKIRLISQPSGLAGVSAGTSTDGGLKAGATSAVAPLTNGSSTAAPAGNGTPTSGTPTSSSASPLAMTAASATVTAATQVAASAACIDVGSFNFAQAKRFEAQMASAAPGVRLARREAPDISSHMVLIPSQGSKEGADKKVAELRRLGLSDLYIIQDNSSLRWAISLGIFKSEEVARAHLAALSQRGVQSARLIEHHVDVLKVDFQLRGLDAAAKAQLERIKPDFPRQEWRNCS
jgi:hypothetical protein